MGLIDISKTSFKDLLTNPKTDSSDIFAQYKLDLIEDEDTEPEDLPRALPPTILNQYKAELCDDDMDYENARQSTANKASFKNYKSQYEDEEATFTRSHPTPDNKENSKSRKTEDPLLKSMKEPRVNTHSLKQLILEKFKFLYSGDLRYYNEEKGYFAELDNHNASVLAYSTIPDNYRSYITFRDITDTLNLLKVTPSIQISPENIPINEDSINLLDKVLDLKSFSQTDHSPNYLFLNCINAKYKDNVKYKDTLFREFIRTITNGDYELERLIKQYSGYVLSNLNNSKTAAILFGESNSGKSVFLKLLTYLCGEENVANVELQKLSDKKYTALLFGKLLNVCNELPDTEITDTGMFKALVSETDKVSARKLYCQPFSFYNRAKLLFATNNLPQINCKSYKDNTAFFNRLVIIPFLNSIPEEKQDKHLFQKLQKEADAIFSWAISGLMEFIENGYKFSYCKISQDILASYRNQCNPAEMFVEDACSFNPEGYTFKYSLVDAYKAFCEIKGFNTPAASDIKLVQNLLQKKFNLQYKKIHRNGENKFGFLGLDVNCEV